jgi:hypothetical protein
MKTSSEAAEAKVRANGKKPRIRAKPASSRLEPPEA